MQILLFSLVFFYFLAFPHFLFYAFEENVTAIQRVLGFPNSLSLLLPRSGNKIRLCSSPSTARALAIRSRTCRRQRLAFLAASASGGSHKFASVSLPHQNVPARRVHLNHYSQAQKKLPIREAFFLLILFRCQRAC